MAKTITLNPDQVESAKKTVKQDIAVYNRQLTELRDKKSEQRAKIDRSKERTAILNEGLDAINAAIDEVIYNKDEAKRVLDELEE